MDLGGQGFSQFKILRYVNPSTLSIRLLDGTFRVDVYKMPNLTRDNQNWCRFFCPPKAPFPSRTPAPIPVPIHEGNSHTISNSSFSSSSFVLRAQLDLAYSSIDAM
jgi:hypothetical protein